MRNDHTSEDILKAAERLLSSAKTLDEVSVRRIAQDAGVNVSAISYHFGSRELLIAEAIRRVYRRFNAERLNRLQAAIDAAAPSPAPVEAIIAALIEPSIRWSFDPKSDYVAFVHFTVVAYNTDDPEIRKSMADNVEHLKPFIAAFRQACPWFSEGEIGWRIHCLLGIRSNVVRYPERAHVLVGDAVDLDDPDDVLRRVVEVSAPMFRKALI